MRGLGHQRRRGCLLVGGLGADVWPVLLLALVTWLESIVAARSAAPSFPFGEHGRRRKKAASLLPSKYR